MKEPQSQAGNNHLESTCLPGGIPVPLVVLGIPLVAVIGVGIASRLHLRQVQPPSVVPALTADFVLRDQPDGSITVFQAPQQRVIYTVPPGTNPFLRVLLSSLAREVRKDNKDMASSAFHVVRWSDGRLTVDDLATHKLIELNAFGPSNANAFSQLLNLSAQPQLR